MPGMSSRDNGGRRRCVSRIQRVASAGASRQPLKPTLHVLPKIKHIRAGRKNTVWRRRNRISARILTVRLWSSSACGLQGCFAPPTRLPAGSEASWRTASFRGVAAVPGADLSAEGFMGDDDHGDLADGGVPMKHLFDLPRINVVSTADDQIFLRSTM